MDDALRTAVTAAVSANGTLAVLDYEGGTARAGAIWELSRVVGRNIPGLTAEQADADFAKMEEILLTSRNRAWIDVILPAAEGRRIVVAVGAAHLSGRDGVLNLLAQKGYALEPAPF